MFEHILVPLDGSSIAECVLPHAVTLGRASEARVTMVRVLEQEAQSSDRSTDPIEWHLRKAEADSYLDEVVQQLIDQGVQVESRLLQGQAAEQVVDYARENRVDLILLSSHGNSGLSEWNVSSVAQKIIFRANTSFLIVPAYRAITSERGASGYQRVLVPLDGSKRAECVLPHLRMLYGAGEPELKLLVVVERPEMPRQAPLTAEEAALAERVVALNRDAAENYLSQVRSRLDGPMEAKVVVGDNLISTLHDFVTEAVIDLIVLSAHGHTGDTRRPFGSVVTSFIAYGSIPLLMIQDIPAEEIAATEAEKVSEQISRSEIDKGGRLRINVE